MAEKGALVPLVEESEDAYRKRVVRSLESLLEPKRNRSITAAKALLDAESVINVATLMYVRDHAVDPKARAGAALEMLRLSMPKPDVNVNISSKQDELLRLYQEELAKAESED